MVRMWLEKVDRLWAIDCSSPMSARMASKVDSTLPSPAGTCRPHSAISVRRPTVFNVTVLPPVLGPVIIMVSKSVPSRKEIGTTVFGSISGCRAFRSSTLP